MDRKIQIPQQKFNALVLDLLIDMHTQISALKDLAFTEYIRLANENAEEIKEAYAEQYEFRNQQLLNRIRTHYSDGDIDDLLKNLSS